MLTENQIEVESGYEPLYNFTLRLNPSNRTQASISPHYPTRGSQSPDPKIFVSPINELARSIYVESGSVALALAGLSPAPAARGTREVGCGGLAPWHLCQTASALNCFLIHWMWGIVGVPKLPERKRFTPTARLRILDAAGALQKSGFAPGDFYFFTGTLPGSTDLACQFFARNSRDILDAFKANLRKNYGIYLTFNCWEWQLREKFHLTPALHLHLIVVTGDEELGSRLPGILKEKWFQLLDYYSEKYAVDLYAKDSKLWNAQEREQGYGRWSREQLDILAARINNPCETCKTIRCDKSPAAYLSKYVGKGSLSDDLDFQDKFSHNNLPLYYPSSWWSISNDVRELIESLTFSVGFRSTLSEVLKAYTYLEEIFVELHPQLIELNLPVFLPPWSTEHRLYRNFYCKEDCFDMIQDILPIFDSTKSEVFYSLPSNPSEDISVRLQRWFDADKNYSKKNELLNSLPFYYRKSGGSDVDWNCPVVIAKGKEIIFESQDNYPEPKTLQQRILELEKSEAKMQSIMYQDWLERHSSNLFDNGN